MPATLNDRMSSLKWTEIRNALDEYGFAKLPVLLDKEQCNDLINSYDEETRFRSTINMARYRFGLGEYKYYQVPLPDPVELIRERLYPELAQIANNWLTCLRKKPIYPIDLKAFIQICHEQGQSRSTPLILKYEEGGYNCLHQDIYGDVYFPFQVVFALNQQGTEYTGGEFMLMEQRPRAQSRGHVITLDQGEGLIFPTRNRPVQGCKGYYSTTLRHGVSTVTTGTRFSLGIIFHDAK